jgi:hypothetical protein
MRTKHLDSLRAFLKPEGETDSSRATTLVQAFQSFGAKESSPSLLLYRASHRRLHPRVAKHLKL